MEKPKSIAATALALCCILLALQGGQLRSNILRKVKKLIPGEGMETGHELFVHGLNDMMDAEHQLVDALRENANDPSRAQLKKAFDQHRRETEGQIERLRQCFKLLGEEPQETECHGVRGRANTRKLFSRLSRATGHFLFSALVI